MPSPEDKILALFAPRRHLHWNVTELCPDFSPNRRVSHSFCSIFSTNRAFFVCVCARVRLCEGRGKPGYHKIFYYRWMLSVCLETRVALHSCFLPLFPPGLQDEPQRLGCPHCFSAFAKFTWSSTRCAMPFFGSYKHEYHESNLPPVEVHPGPLMAHFFWALDGELLFRHRLKFSCLFPSDSLFFAGVLLLKLFWGSGGRWNSVRA